MKYLRKYIREALEDNESFDNIISAIHTYTSLAQDPAPLIKLLGTPELKRFMSKMQEQIPEERIWASRKLNFRDQYIADKWYVEEGKGEEIDLNGPVSFYFGEPPTEFAKNRYTLQLRIPKEKIIFHSEYNEEFGIKSEREILTEGMTIVVTSVREDDDWEGNMLATRVTARVVG